MSRSRDTADQVNRIDSSAADATAITIDSSENVYVGKTASGFNDAGLELEGQGRARITRDGAVSLQLNRLNTHGDMALFYIDGSAKGDIGTDNGRLKIGSTSASGLRFDLAQLIPFVGTSASDNAVDLGWSTSRFRDAYIGGGVYLGGTGAANKLDDYEEGTWTPVFDQGATGGSYSIQTGHYVKVGRVVHIEMDFDGSGWTGDSNGIRFGGLPFAGASASGLYGGGFINYQISFFTTAQTAEVVFHIGANTQIQLYNRAGSAVTGSSVTNVNSRLIVSAKYFTDA